MPIPHHSRSRPLLMNPCMEHVLLRKVAENFQKLATRILQSMATTPPPSSSTWQTPALEALLMRLLLLHCRSKDVLAEFSGYYCLRVLLDIESPLATYFIDLFHQLEWLLEALLRKSGERASEDSPLPEDLGHKIYDLLGCIMPAVRSCRYSFCISEVLGKEMKRKAKAHRDFSMDDFRFTTNILPFVNLDRCAENNKVELGIKLGKGGYASVYKGKFVTWDISDPALRRPIGESVAVKVFGGMWDETAGASKSVGAQFYNQMEKMVQLKESVHTASLMTAEEISASKELWKLVTAKHPNVVTARGYIGKRSQGDSGLVMELMSTSLQTYLQEVDKPLEELEMVDLMLEIAKGMRFLHECGLVHKDLKPQNILLRPCKVRRWDKYPAMEVKLADFGLTERIIKGDAYGSGMYTGRAGTYCYMAPEVLHITEYQTSNYPDEVDVFSFGTTCFNILTCNVRDALEFTSPYSKDEFYKAVKSNDWGAWVNGKPEYLIDLIARCWDFDPSRRPTFATICSLLQRAMLWILSSPVMDVVMMMSRGDYARGTECSCQVSSKHSSDELWLQSEKDAFTLLHDDAHSFVKEWNKYTRRRGYSTSARTEANVHGLLSKLQRKKTKPSKSVAVRSEGLVFAPIDEANDSDFANAYTSTPVIRVMAHVQSIPRLFQIPLTTMDPAWIVFKALVCSSIYSYFEDRGCRLGRLCPLKEYPFQEDEAKTELNVDRSLIPFLICFWERGNEVSWWYI